MHNHGEEKHLGRKVDYIIIMHNHGEDYYDNEMSFFFFFFGVTEV